MDRLGKKQVVVEIYFNLCFHSLMKKRNWLLALKRWGSKGHLLAIVAIIIVTGIFFVRLFLPEPKLFYTPDYALSDMWNFNYPVKNFLSLSLKQGELPFWSKSLGTGFPVFAEAQVGALFLPNLVLYYLFPTWLAFNLSFILAFFTSCFGAYLFFQKLGISRRSSLFSALVFAFGAYFVTKIVHLNYLQSATLLPLVFYLATSFWENPSLKYALLLSLLVSQQILAGGMQWVFISILGVLIFIFSLRQESDLNELSKKTFLLLAVLVMAGLFAAPQLLPTLEYKNISNRRTPLLSDQIFEYPFGWQHFILFLFPNFYGSPATGSYPSPFENDIGIFWENAVYLGALPILFFLAALFRRGKKPWEKSLLLLIVLSVLLAVGKQSPISFIYVFPGFNWFRVPSRFLILTTFSISALAGVGLDNVLSSRLLSKFKLLRRKRLKFYIYIALVLIALLNLFTFGFTYHPLVSISEALTVPDTATKIPPGERILTHGTQKDAWNGVFFTKGWQDPADYLYFKNGLAPNLNLIFNRDNVGVYTSFLPIRQVFQEFYLKRLVAALGVKHIISPVVLEEGDELELEFKIKAARQGLPNYYVYKYLKSLDRFHFVSNYEVADTFNETVDFLKNEDFSFSETAMLEEDVDLKSSELTESQIDVLEDNDQRLVLKTKTNGDAVLIVADSFFPGWKAKIDNQETGIVAANINQRALLIPSGEHTIEMYYYPETFYKGAMLSAGAFLVFGSIIILTKFGSIIRLKLVFQRLFSN